MRESYRLRYKQILNWFVRSWNGEWAERNVGWETLKNLFLGNIQRKACGVKYIVVKPIEVINKLKENYWESFLILFKLDFEPLKNKNILNNDSFLNYGYLFNAVFMLSISQSFLVLEHTKYSLLCVHTGKLRTNNELNINTNLYPVPDLDVPFWGAFYSRC